MLKKMALGTIIFALLGAGCTPLSGKNASSELPTWENVDHGIARYDCPPAACGNRIIIYRFQKGAFSWSLKESETSRTVEGWANDLPSAVFVLNGVYFDENGKATGALVMKGKRVSAKEYELDKSGIIELAPETRVIDTAKEKSDLDRMEEAAQSFPLVIKSGEPVESFKDARGARRTMIGNDADGNVYAISIPEDAATFADTARALKKIGVKWDNVLNLDGGTSTGFAARTGSWTETMNSIVQVPNVLVVEKK